MQLQRDIRVSRSLMVQGVQDIAALHLQREAVVDAFRDGSDGRRWSRKQEAISRFVGCWRWY